MVASMSRPGTGSILTAGPRPTIGAVWLHGDRLPIPTTQSRKAPGNGTASPAPARPHRALVPVTSRSRTNRAALRALWDSAGRPWDQVPTRHGPRNLSIARAYLEADETLQAIAARHDMSHSQALTIARQVVYSTLAACRRR